MGLLARLFGDAEAGAQRDGQSEASVARGTGIAPAVLEAGLAQPPDPGRRARALALPQDEVTQAVAAKVLDFWLQNRHQTLYPLTVNFAALEPRQGVLLARVMAVALLAGAGPAETAPAEAWLNSVGGAAAALHDALKAPPPLNELMDDVLETDVAAYAYVVALAAGAGREPAGRMFLDYLAARLGLPAEVVRSANRRYRR